MNILSTTAILISILGAILLIISFKNQLNSLKNDFKTFNLAQKLGIILTIFGGVLLLILNIIR